MLAFSIAVAAEVRSAVEVPVLFVLLPELFVFVPPAVLPPFVPPPAVLPPPAAPPPPAAAASPPIRVWSVPFPGIVVIVFAALVAVIFSPVRLPVICR